MIIKSRTKRRGSKRISRTKRTVPKGGKRSRTKRRGPKGVSVRNIKKPDFRIHPLNYTIEYGRSIIKLPRDIMHILDKYITIDGQKIKILDFDRGIFKINGNIVETGYNVPSPKNTGR